MGMTQIAHFGRFIMILLVILENDAQQTAAHLHFMSWRPIAWPRLIPGT
jgi:hypothetical protein